MTSGVMRKRRFDHMDVYRETVYYHSLECHSRRFDDKQSASVTLSNGITAYTHETRREASLSYQDGEQTVLLGGNVPVASLKILAESLLP